MYGRNGNPLMATTTPTTPTTTTSFRSTNGNGGHSSSHGSSSSRALATEWSDTTDGRWNTPLHHHASSSSSSSSSAVPNMANMNMNMANTPLSMRETDDYGYGNYYYQQRPSTSATSAASGAAGYALDSTLLTTPARGFLDTPAAMDGSYLPMLLTGSPSPPDGSMFGGREREFASRGGRRESFSSEDRSLMNELGSPDKKWSSRPDAGNTPPQLSLFDDQQQEPQQQHLPERTNGSDSELRHLSSMDSSTLSDNWVTIFGFPSAAAATVLQYFQNFGDILQYEIGEGNWINVRYNERLQAQRALSRNGKFIHSNLLVGVVPCDPLLFRRQDTDRMGVHAPVTTAGGAAAAATATDFKSYRPSDHRYEIFSSKTVLKTPIPSASLLDRIADYFFGW